MHLISCKDRKWDGVEIQASKFSLTLCKYVLGTLARGRFAPKLVHHKGGNIMSVHFENESLSQCFYILYSVNHP